MALKIKGLDLNALGAMKGLEAARGAVAKMNTSLGALTAAAIDLAAHADQVRKDLEFGATQLGNSGNSSETVSDEQKVSLFRQAGLGDLVEADKTVESKNEPERTNQS